MNSVGFDAGGIGIEGVSYEDENLFYGLDGLLGVYTTPSGVAKRPSKRKKEASPQPSIEAALSSELERKNVVWTTALKDRLCHLKATGATDEDVKQVFKTELGVDVTVKAVVAAWCKFAPSHLKRPKVQWTAELRDRLRVLKAEGKTYSIITDMLNTEFKVHLTLYAVQSQGKYIPPAPQPVSYVKKR